MSRTNSRHSRQLEQRRRRNKGPELLMKAADNELQQKATQMAEGLSQATINKGDVAAAGMLLTLAECANYNQNPGAFGSAFSLADKWAKEPQVTGVDTGPQLMGPPIRGALTDGSPQSGETPTADSEVKNEPDASGIVEGEYEMVGEAAAEAKPLTSLSG
jgi:hypothetical protein